MYNLEKKYTCVDSMMMHWIAYVTCLYCFLTIIGIDTPDELAFSELLAVIFLGMMINQQEAEIKAVKEQEGKIQGFYVLDKVRYAALPRPRGYPKYLRPPQRDFPTPARKTKYPNPQDRNEMAAFGMKVQPQPQPSTSRRDDDDDQRPLHNGSDSGDGGNLTTSYRGGGGARGDTPSDAGNGV